jgi:hypothetical protein
MFGGDMKSSYAFPALLVLAALSLTACETKQTQVCASSDVQKVLRGLLVGSETPDPSLDPLIDFSSFSGRASEDSGAACQADYSIAPTVIEEIKSKDPHFQQNLVAIAKGAGLQVSGGGDAYLSGEVSFTVSQHADGQGQVSTDVTLTNFSIANARALKGVIDLYLSLKNSAHFIVPAVVSWDSQADGAKKLYEGGGLQITMSSKPGSGSEYPTPYMEVADGTNTVSEAGDQGFQVAAARFLVGKLDPEVKGDQVIFTTFSGGAHCCTRVDVLEPQGTGTKIVSLGSWDGEPLDKFPSDIDNDHVPDIVMNDDRFNYAFASHADSFAPVRVFNVIGGNVIDHSSAPGLKNLYESEMIEFGGWCLLHSNGACAAFVAAGARAGHAGYAWEVMQQNYNRADTWQLPTSCRVPVSGGSCPADQTVQAADYPSALMQFLRDNEYPISDPPQDANLGPSFDCGKVRSQVLKLVCDTPELTKLDLQLASAYFATKTNSKQPADLVASEIEWIKTRNNGAADAAAVGDLYRQRIAALLSEAQQQNQTPAQ